MSDIDPDYTREFVPGNIKLATSASGASRNALYMVPISEVVVDERFNVRIHDAMYERSVEKIKDSIIANGFYKHKPLSGYAGLQDDVNVIYLTGGFTRFAAAKRAIEAGAPIKAVPVILRPPGTNMIDLTIALDVDNGGTPLRPYERAKVAKRLLGFGLTEQEIALRLGYSKGYISTLLYVLSLPQGLQKLVIAGRVNAMYAAQKAREMGPERALAMMEGELELVEDTIEDPPDYPSDNDNGTDADTGPRERPQVAHRVPRKPGNITAKVALTAIDHALAMMEDDFDAGFEWLLQWRQGDKAIAEEVKGLMRAARKKRGVPANNDEPVVHPPLTDKEVADGAKSDMDKESRRLERELGPAKPPPDDDDDAQAEADLALINSGAKRRSEDDDDL